LNRVKGAKRISASVMDLAFVLDMLPAVNFYD